MNHVLPEDSVIGSWDAGVLGYFSRFPVVNLDVVVNPGAISASQKGRNRGRVSSTSSGLTISPIWCTPKYDSTKHYSKGIIYFNPWNVRVVTAARCPHPSVVKGLNVAYIVRVNKVVGFVGVQRGVERHQIDGFARQAFEDRQILPIIQLSKPGGRRQPHLRQEPV